MPEAVQIAPPSTEAAEPHPELRQAGIGGSDIAAIVGVDPYKTALDIYMAKKGMGEQRRTPEMREAAQFGHLLEDLVASTFASRAGLRVLPPPGMLANVDRPWMLANPDRMVTDIPAGRVPAADRAILEIKTRSAWQAGDWRDEPADAAAVQLAWYLAVTGLRKGYIAALIGGNRLSWYTVERDDEVIALLIDAALEFRQRLDDDDPPPADGSARTANLLDSIWLGDPDSFLLLNDQQAAVMKAHCDAITDAKRLIAEQQYRAEMAENEIKLMMGEAEVAIANGHQVLATWRRNGTFRSKLFLDEQPELAAMYTVQKPAIDTRKLAADEPEWYTTYRARKFLLGKGSEGER